MDKGKERILMVLSWFSIGLLFGCIAFWQLQTVYLENTYYQKEFQGKFINYYKDSLKNNGTELNKYGGYFFRLENVTVTQDGLFPMVITQTEFYFHDIKYPFDVIDSFIGKNVFVSVTMNGYEMGDINLIRQIEG